MGYPSVAVEVTAADRTTSEWCVLLAADARARSRGLMEVDSLGRFDGMLFDFDTQTEGQFYMLRTRIPLTVAFFNATSFVSSADMEPCPEDDNEPPCPLYGADDLYDVALEVPQGGLGRLGIGPGSQLRALDRTC